MGYRTIELQREKKESLGGTKKWAKRGWDLEIVKHGNGHWNPENRNQQK